MNRMSSLSQPRQSTIASGQASSNAQQRYIDKKAEYEGVTALNAASELMVQQLEEIASRTDLMADGGVAIGSVLANWPNVWRIIGLAASSGQNQGQEEDGANQDESRTDTVPRLVRIEVNSSDASSNPEP
ncbi:hypothetical protein FRC12_007684 [Ceratobasidium sp. 428]|nr:hypothetical protein FRC12_007684 [Ceratobasidium sp. 428]